MGTMLEDKNTWRNKFHSSDLEKEDWLEPSEGLFAAIEKEIYEEEDKKKGILLPLSLLACLLLLATAFYFGKALVGDNNALSQTSELQESTNKKVAYTSAIVPQEDIEETDYAAKNKVVSKSETSEVGSKKTSPVLSSTKETVSRTRDKFLPAQRTTANSRIAERRNIDFTQTITAPSVSGLLPSMSSDKAKTEITQLAGKSNLQDKLLPLSFLNSKVSQPTWLYSRAKAPYTGGFSKVDLSKVTKAANALYYGMGVAVTNFRLNQTFVAAVDPADFTHSSNRSPSAHLGYSYGISNKFSAFIEANYIATKFSSGHNSVYEYSVGNESNNAINVTLPMATPLGFMEGSAVITRVGDTESSVPLILDLHNNHSFHSLGLTAGISYDFLTVRDFTFRTQLGLGLEQIFGLRNELVEVNSSNPLFQSSDRSIISDQSDFMRTLSSSLLGLSIDKSFSDSYSLSLRYRWVNGLHSIYNQDGLGTDFHRHDVNISLAKKF